MASSSSLEEGAAKYTFDTSKRDNWIAFYRQQKLAKRQPNSLQSIANLPACSFSYHQLRRGMKGQSLVMGPPRLMPDTAVILFRQEHSETPPAPEDVKRRAAQVLRDYLESVGVPGAQERKFSRNTIKMYGEKLFGSSSAAAGTASSPSPAVSSPAPVPLEVVPLPAPGAHLLKKRRLNGKKTLGLASRAPGSTREYFPVPQEILFGGWAPSAAQ